MAISQTRLLALISEAQALRVSLETLKSNLRGLCLGWEALSSAELALSILGALDSHQTPDLPHTQAESYHFQRTRGQNEAAATRARERRAGARAKGSGGQV